MAVAVGAVMHRTLTSIAAVGSLFLAQSAEAATHTVSLSTTTVDGSAFAPGDTVCIAPGKRSILRFERVVGSAAAPIVIKACGGVAEIGNTDRGYALTFGKSKHFRLTGTGVLGAAHGIRITGTASGGSGLSLGDLSTDFEVDNLEIAKAGFAGIMAKTDPRCDLSANRGKFVMRNVTLHDNWIHDVGGEGFYVGYSFYGGREHVCDGKTVTLYPHDIVGLRIFGNKVERTGWDGIQVGCAVEDVKIHDNVVRDYGLENVSGQKSGIQFNAGTTGDIERNVVQKGKGGGIFVMGRGNTIVHDNLIVDAGGDGILCDDRATTPGAFFRFVNNTIVRAGRHGIAMYSVESKGNFAWNNLIVASTSAPIQLMKSGIDWSVQNNLTFSSTTEAGFVSSTDFRLAMGSKAVDAGREVASLGIKLDLDRNARAVGPTDVGAYERGSKPPIEGDAGAGDADAAPPIDTGVAEDAAISDDAGTDAHDASPIEDTATSASDGSPASDAAPPAAPSDDPDGPGITCSASAGRAGDGTVAILCLLGALVRRLREVSRAHRDVASSRS